MAKTLRTSGDYKVKTGAGYNGGAGSNTIDLDSRYVRIRGDLTVDGDQVVQNVTNTTIEDQFIEVNRNNSTAGTEDSGIVFNGGSSANAILFFDASRNEFVMATTTTAYSVANCYLPKAACIYHGIYMSVCQVEFLALLSLPPPPLPPPLAGGAGRGDGLADER